MQKIFKVGNSRGVTIPKAYADQLGLNDGSLVEIRLVGEELILKSAKPKYTLADLLAEMPDDCNEAEVDYGPDVGEEVIE